MIVIFWTPAHHFLEKKSHHWKKCGIIGCWQKSRFEFIGLGWKISGQPGNLWQQSWFGARALPQPSPDFLQKMESFEGITHKNVFASAFQKEKDIPSISHWQQSGKLFMGYQHSRYHKGPIPFHTLVWSSHQSPLIYTSLTLGRKLIDLDQKTWLPVCIFLGQSSRHHIACSHGSLGKEQEASNDARSPAARGTARNSLTTFARSRWPRPTCQF